MKYVFLDFNGTVLDDVDLCLDLLNTMLASKGCQPVDKIRYKEIFQFPVIEYYKKAGFTFDGYTFGELADIFIDEYTRRNNQECHIFPDFKNFIELLRSQNFKVVLCSASKLNLLIDQLNEFDILQYFDDVIGLDNHHATSKLQLAQEYVRCHNINSNQAFFVGDTTHDAEVGHALGMHVILVERGHQSYNVLSQVTKNIAANLVDAFYMITK